MRCFVMFVTSFLTLKKVHLNQKSKSLVEYITKSASIRVLLCSIFDHCLKILFLSVLFLIVSYYYLYYFFHIWTKTLWIASPKEHEKKRWKTWRCRVEEISCLGKNKSEAMESKSSLYVFRKSRFFEQAKGPCERNLRKRFELCVVAVRFGAQDEKSEYQLFHSGASAREARQRSTMGKKKW